MVIFINKLCVCGFMKWKRNEYSQVLNLGNGLIRASVFYDRCKSYNSTDKLHWKAVLGDIVIGYFSDDSEAKKEVETKIKACYAKLTEELKAEL